MIRSFGTVMFSHGKEGGPWGVKITAMAAVVRDLGLAVESLDYRGMEEPTARVDKLIGAAANVRGAVVLVGSSLGGHVSAAAASRVEARGVFLLAPAFYMPGFDADTPRDIACPAAVVHGWHDDVVPVDNSVRWAREQGAALHVLDSDHRLEDRIDAICLLLRAFLTDLA